MATYSPQQGHASKPSQAVVKKNDATLKAPSRRSAFTQAVQTKLTVGPSNDHFEQEADRAARMVTQGHQGSPTITPLPLSSVQKAEAHERKAKKQLEEDDLVQRSDKGPAPTVAPTGVQSGIRAASGGGQSMPQNVRQQMEGGLGRDFSSVKIHNDARAHRMSSALNAKAFTTGSDIFFARSAYNPESADGQFLLAHELTHVAQQTGSNRVQAKHIQKNGDDTASVVEEEQPETKPTQWPYEGKTSTKGKIFADDDHSKLLLVLPELKLPSYNRKTKGVERVGTVAGGFGTGQQGFIPGHDYHWFGKGHRRVTDENPNAVNSSQVAEWERYFRNQRSGDLAGHITNTFQNTTPQYENATGDRVYFLRLKRGGSSTDHFAAIGTATQLERDSILLRPPFGPDGKFTFMEVDHYIEIQLGGAHQIDNMWLLDKSTNASSGSSIKNSVVNDIRELVSEARSDEFWGDTNPAAPSTANRKWPSDIHMEFSRVQEVAKDNSQAWDKDDIANGEHLEHLRVMTTDEMSAAGFTWDGTTQPTRLTVFLSETSPYRRAMRVDGSELTPDKFAKENFIRGFNFISAEYAPEAELAQGKRVGSLIGIAFGNRTVEDNNGNEVKQFAAPLLRIPLLARELASNQFAAYIDNRYIDTKLRTEAARLAQLSPLAFQHAGISEAWELSAGGKVTADNPLFSGFEFEIKIIGDTVILSVDLPTDKLNFGPFSVTEASLSIGMNSDGLLYGGAAAFELAGVGQGTVEANESLIRGMFAFDIDAFDPAEVEVTYQNGRWSAAAILGVSEGKIPFVKGGNIEVRVDENGFYFSGTANLEGPGIPQGTALTVLYDPETKVLSIASEIPLDTSRLPGVSNARIGVQVVRGEEGEWKVAGQGRADLQLPNVTGSADIIYDDGIIQINGAADVERPPVSGRAQFHLSNQAVDAQGLPVEGPPLNRFRVWGEGEASIKFGDYITGTIGMAFLENGEIEYLGRVALPPSIELIAAEVYHYDIFDFPEVRFPILGMTIPVINRSFGVFGFVRGGLDANVTLGPAELVDSEVEVNFNPDRPQETRIEGGTRLQVSAAADVGLTVTGGVGAGLGIVEATGEIGLRGAMGLELEGGGSIGFNWTPNDGLAIDASVTGEAKPTFSVALVAEAKVVVDAFLWSGTLWNESWEEELASIGPDFALSARLPAAWSEREGLDMDINNLEITRPDINLSGLAGEVFEQVV